MELWANFHTHTTFSDGKNTPEEVVNYAMEQGFCSLGFSDHAFTKHDQRYCMQDEQGYILEINRLKAKYADKLQIYLGVEEDGSQLLDRTPFDYLIGSLHYLAHDGKNLIMDSNYDYFSACREYYEDDLSMAKAYYDRFIRYLQARKPDVIGHFDLVTKYDEAQVERFLRNEQYWEIAENATKNALAIGSIFEINTGLITRGFRSTPCPHERLLKVIARNGGKVTLSSDAHRKEDLCAHFKEMTVLLKSVGFDGIYILYDKKWQKREI